MSARLIVMAALLATASAGFAQSSTNFRITGSSLVTTAGDTSSPNYVARVVGGEGAPAQSTGSAQYGLVIGSGDPDPVNAERVFGSNFEGATLP